MLYTQSYSGIGGGGIGSSPLVTWTFVSWDGTNGVLNQSYGAVSYDWHTTNGGAIWTYPGGYALTPPSGFAFIGNTQDSRGDSWTTTATRYSGTLATTARCSNDP